MAVYMLLTPARPISLSKEMDGFPSNHTGTEAMTTPRKTLVLPQRTPTARPEWAQAADLIQLHAQACNGLQAALHHLTTPSTEPDAITLSRALSRAIRATTALKQACAVAKEGGMV